MTAHHDIAVIPGDGIGLEVTPAAIRVLERVGQHHDITFGWQSFDWSCEHYTQTGQMMPDDGIDRLREHEAIFLGAVGYPGVPDHVSLWGLLIPIRRAFEQYINLRPVKLLRGIASPLAGVDELDFICVRENTEGEYSEIGGRLYAGTPHELAVQEAVFTRRGVTRAMQYAFALAEDRAGTLVSATKSNGIIHTMPFWDEICREVAAEHAGVSVRQMHIDALAALFVLDPGSLDVVVASNLFGDILTDLGAAIVGSIGIAPSANLNPDREFPSMFEPVHGSAPDIAGQGVANPIGQVWAGAMMLEHLGHPDAAADLLAAVESTLASTATKTPDLGGHGDTAKVTEAILTALDVRAGATSEGGDHV